MIRPFSLSLTALWVFTCLPRAAQAQYLVPIFQLSAEETAKASQLAQDVKNARERNLRAYRAWETFHQSYQSGHPDLPNVQFTSDFRLALTSRGSSSALDAEQQRVTSVELSAKEQQELKALHQEITESQQSLRQPENNWMDYQHLLAADHVPSKGEDGSVTVTLGSGKQVTISPQWGSGLAFTPDYRLAVPRIL
jgi:hypothetical protein